ncbi:hypothetical protein DERP_002727 [Dermatophagoides pteronyssinus]|uniref:Uncharacterized protein n=1 Tax=Dermatophagoides pteronyssinus TaxID=6956 RepID=A0ABQ8JVI7_DERPT|nr:hypothetical protein DERP_002727 [Dermatophagoides pteronyssinus]
MKTHKKKTKSKLSNTSSFLLFIDPDFLSITFDCFFESNPLPLSSSFKSLAPGPLAFFILPLSSKQTSNSVADDDDGVVVVVVEILKRFVVPVELVVVPPTILLPEYVDGIVDTI